MELTRIPKFETSLDTDPITYVQGYFKNGLLILTVNKPCQLTIGFNKIIIQELPKKDKDELGICPKCNKKTVEAKQNKEGGGVGCKNPNCDYREIPW